MASVLALAQVQTVSFIGPVNPLRTLIPEMGRAIDRKLNVTPDLEWQLLYVRATGVPEGELLSKVARATYGRWVSHQDGSLTLELDRSRLAVDQQKAMKARIAYIRKSLADEFEELKKGRDADDDDYVNQAHPTVLGILAAFGPEQLAGMEIGRRVVYSNRPTSAQKSFPKYDPAWEVAIRKAENSSRALLATRLALPKDPELLKIEQMLDPAYWQARNSRATSGLFSRETITKPFARFDVAIRAEVSGIRLEIMGYDDRGMQEYVDGSGIAWWDADVSESPESTTESDRATLKLSRSAAEVAKFWSEEEPSSEIQSAMLAPGDDPFLKTYRELLDFYADGQKENLVLGFSERSMYATEGSVSRESIRDWIATHRRAVVAGFMQDAFASVQPDRNWEIKDGWRISTPQSPPVAHNRDDLRSIAQRLAKKSLSFEDRAWMSARCFYPHEEISGLPCEWLPTLFARSVYDLDAPLLAVYGHLSTSDQGRLRRGEALPVRNLSPAARSILRDLCTTQVGTLLPPPATVVRDYITAISYRFDFTQLDEPTVAAPYGLPDDAYLTLKSETRTAYVSAPESKWIEEADGIAVHDLASKYISLMVDPEKAVKESDLIETRHEVITLTLLISAGIGCDETFTIRLPSDRDQPIKLSQVVQRHSDLIEPKLKMRQQYEAYLAARKKYFGSKQENPPPPVE